MSRRIALLATLALGVSFLVVPTAAANPPERSATITFTHTDPDFFAPSGQHCAFPVFGSWDVVLKTVTYFDAADNPVRAVTRFSYVGTLSNPLTGKSIPDASKHPENVTDYYAPDGMFLKEVDIESRDDQYLHAAFHAVMDPNGNIIADNGRDWFFTASHVIDLQPLCAALS
jgi:hypothetical protein